MKSKSISIGKYVLKYGIILGILIIISSFLFYITGNYSKQNTLHFVILLLITIYSITIGLITFKNKNNGFIHLGEALKIATGISILGGLMGTLWEISLLTIIDPDMIIQLQNNEIKRLAEASTDITQESIDQKIQFTQKVKSPFMMLATSFIEDLIVGILFGLIGGLIIRKKRDPFS